MSELKVSDGTRLFYNDWGTGAPVVLVHGWPLSGAMWEYQATFLVAQGLRVITYDRRGFGRSDQPAAGYDYDTLTGDLAALIDHLGVDNATLVGFSMGGGEVARYLARHNRGRVTQGVLISSVTPLLQKAPSYPEGVDPQVFAEMQAKLLEDRPAFLATFAKQFYGVGVLSKPVSSDILDWNQQLALQASPIATLACERSFATTDFRADLAAIRVPVTVIHGDADKTVPIDSTGRVAASMIQGARYVVYEGEPHGLFITAKERLNQDLLAIARQRL